MYFDPLQIDAIQLILTENCTLKCKYCYETMNRICSAKMNIETLHNAVDYFVERAKAINLKRTHFILFGGEPLLCPELIEEFLKYSKYKETISGVRITSNIITNGTIFDESLMKIIYDINGKDFIPIQISTDGIPKSQNINRPMNDNTNKTSSELIAENVKKYLEFFDEMGIDKNKLSFHICITHDSLPYINDNFLYCAESLNISNGNFMTVVEDQNFSLDDISIYEEQMQLVYDSAKRLKWEKYPIATFGRVALCDAGWRHFCVGIDGDIFGCPRFYFNTRNNIDEYNKFKMGNVNNQYSSNPLDDSNNILSKNVRDFLTLNIGTQGSVCKICMGASYEKTGMLCSILNPFLNRLFEIGKEYNNKFNKK